MSEKLQRHHYVPKFYLAHWCVKNEDLLLLHTKDEFGKVFIGKKSPYSVSYLRGLYTSSPEKHPFPTLPSNHIEDNFFKRLDNDASLIHKKLVESGVASLNSDERTIWSMFINSLLERGPVRINEVLEKANAHTEELIQSMSNLLNSSPYGQPPPMSYIDIPALARNSVLTGMVHSICDHKTLEYFFNLRWTITHLTGGEDHFLTGDCPVVINGGQSETYPIHVISIALSPNKLLIMHTDSDEFDEEIFVKLSMVHNPLIVEQTQKYLVSSRAMTDEGCIKNKRILDLMFKK
ncbi:DUF4238 domain-containing protein [Methylophilus sp. QUAN]|uniref:DUF4238 domain-containing protein n=1 Tax=Methylophilus sp. QUAN TaxID=2781020 RepID=UPI00188EAE6E|nr:DUF4238 domain-containing protein [Methylophilus sp. QUAN]MBF4990501.1 DUF4238 domain-containing protein [Methylophilus sp. QUAN]